MDVDRKVYQGGKKIAIQRVKFCLDRLEAANFNTGFGWEIDIVKRLTLEEMIGALVSAEQELGGYNGRNRLRSRRKMPTQTL
jgi:hypothetical protein